MAEVEERFHLRLYIAGATPKSAQAVANIKNLCETHLQGRYELEVVDIYQQPELTQGEELLITPTLIRRLPLPLARFVGNLVEEESVLLGLALSSGSAA